MVCPLFFLRKRAVVRGGRALFWSQPDDPEARFLKRQLSVAVPRALLLTAGVGMQMLLRGAGAEVPAQRGSFGPPTTGSSGPSIGAAF